MLLPRLHAALALVPVVWACSSSSFAETKPAPLGLDIYGASYALVSNRSWDVTVIGSDVERHAKEVKLVHLADPDGVSAEARQTEAYIWAGKCPRIAQQLAFKRTFWLPGPAKTFAAEFAATNSANPNTRPIESFRVFINGSLIAEVDGAQMTSDVIFARFVIEETTETIPQLITYGDNEIVVEVSKRKQPAAQDKCMDGTTPLGFRFNLHGTFEGDLRVGPKKVGPGCYDDAGNINCFEKVPQDAVGIVVPYGQFFSNLGPSAVYTAEAFVDIIGSGAKFKDFSTASVDVEGCIWRFAAATNVQLDCDLTKIKKKWSAKFTLYLELVPIFSAPRLTVKVYYSGRTADPDGGNNDIFFTVTYCRPNATSDRCTALYASDVRPKLDVSSPNYWLGPPR